MKPSLENSLLLQKSNLVERILNDEAISMLFTVRGLKKKQQERSLL